MLDVIVIMLIQVINLIDLNAFVLFHILSFLFGYKFSVLSSLLFSLYIFPNSKETALPLCL